LVTKIGRADGSFTNEEKLKQYWYHSDHLGSAQLISNVDGEEYERIEYTPYGELWIEKASAASNIDIPYRFTGKEQDDETGLYYYGARYLDPKYSRWLSTDPALTDYIPGAPINDEVKKKNGELPGMGGVFNTVNLHLYHYAGNNPVKYIDPNGRQMAIPLPRIMLPRTIPLPRVLPKTIPIPPILILPSEDYNSGRYSGDIDWHNPPQSPENLGPEWEEEPRDPRNPNRTFKNKDTDETIRWDTGEKREQGGHWHRENPNSNQGNKDAYLDKDGNPVPKGGKKAHIYPKESPVPPKLNPFDIPIA
jgi:RHS repeat-associated protein